MGTTSTSVVCCPVMHPEDLYADDLDSNDLYTDFVIAAEL